MLQYFRMYAIRMDVNLLNCKHVQKHMRRRTAIVEENNK